MKWFVLIFMTFFGIFKSQNVKSAKVVALRNEVEKIQNEKNLTKKKFSVVGKNLTKIDYEYELKAGKIVSIQRTWNEKRDNYIDKYEDSFTLKNKKPIFAYQSIYYENIKDKNDIGGWSVSCWIENFKVLDMTSNGHGKTELDDWDYDKEFRDNFAYMMKIIKKHYKNK